jgi:glycosyltransferase involved in cell wall biosynthesis
MTLSVLINTYNDAHVLPQCLRALLDSSVLPNEVIIIDDGSTDTTEKFLQEAENWFSQKNIAFYTEKIPNSGRSISRNKGIEKVTQDIVLILGADIVLKKNSIKEFLDFHRENDDKNIIAFGPTPFPQEYAKERFSRWLMSSGVMVSYSGLKNKETTDFWHFYTGNISFKRTFLQQFRFCTDFQEYGFEDILLGSEMLANGGKLFFLKQASGEHIHRILERDFFPKRAESIGASAVIFQKKAPHIKVLPQGLKLCIFKIISHPLSLFLLQKIRKEWYWYALYKKYFLEGAGREW